MRKRRELRNRHKPPHPAPFIQVKSGFGGSFHESIQRQIGGPGGFRLGVGANPAGLAGLETWQPWRRRLQAWWLGARFLGTHGVVFEQPGNDCGWAALQMVLGRFDGTAAAQEARRLVRLKPPGTTLRTLGEAAESLGLRAYGWILQAHDLKRVSLPVLAWLKGGRYVVIDQLLEGGSLVVLDPAVGRLLYKPQAFWRQWTGEALLFSRQGAAKPLPLDRPGEGGEGGEGVRNREEGGGKA